MFKYQKMHIIGGPGSGKTYCAKRIGVEAKLPIYDLDDLFWDKSSFVYARSDEKVRDLELSAIVDKDRWIIEGVYYKWLAKSFDAADVIVILNVPVLKRQARLFKRFLSRKIFGHSRIETVSNFFELVKWNQKFDKDNMLRVMEFLKEYESKVIFCKDYNELVAKIHA